MHGPDVAQPVSDTDDLFRNVNGVRILAEDTTNHCVRIAGFYHHHAEIVSLKHLLGCFIECHPLTVSFFGEEGRIAQPSLLFPVVPQVHDFDTLEADLVLPCHVGDFLLIAQQDGMTDPLGIGCFRRLEHVQVVRLREYDPFGILSCHLKKSADHLVVEAHQVT